VAALLSGKNIFISVFFVAFLIIVGTVFFLGARKTSEDTLWKEALPPFSGSREEFGADLAGENILILGGIRRDLTLLRSVETYNAQGRVWRERALLPKPLHHPGVAVVRERLYVIGGFVDLDVEKNLKLPLGSYIFEPSEDVYEFKIALNQWGERAPLPTRRGAAGVAVVKGKIYVFGGMEKDGAISHTLEVYDPDTDSWERKSDMPTARDHLLGTSIGGLVYAIGGRQGTLQSNLDAVEIYDPVTDRWISGPPLPVARGGMAGGSFGKYILAVGGEEFASTFARVDLFDSERNQWVRLPDFPYGVHGAGAVFFEDKFCVLGGGLEVGLSDSATVWCAALKDIREYVL